MDEYATYIYDLHFFSSDHKNTAGVKGATKIIAEQISEGNKSEIKVRFVGELEILQVQDDPNEIGQPLPGGGSELDNIPEQEPEQNDDVLNQIEKQEEAEGEQGQEKQPEEELEPEPEEQKQDEKQEELEEEEEKTKEKTKEKQRQKQKDKQKEDELQDDPEYSGEK
jgi:outer membrane biosynthesis protein TonB